MAAYDAIVLGLGGMGSATLFHLARRGLSVLGLERFDLVHEYGSSHGLTRIIRLAYWEHPTYVALLRRSYELWRELEGLAGEQLLHITGSVDAGPEAGAIFQGALRSSELHGLAHEVMDGDELHRRYPGYRLPKEIQCLYQPEGRCSRCSPCTTSSSARPRARSCRWPRRSASRWCRTRRWRAACCRASTWRASPTGARFTYNKMHQTRYADQAYWQAAEAFARTAAELGHAPPALAVAWVASHPSVTSVLIGAAGGPARRLARRRRARPRSRHARSHLRAHARARARDRSQRRAHARELRPEIAGYAGGYGLRATGPDPDPNPEFGARSPISDTARRPCDARARAARRPRRGCARARSRRPSR